MPNETGKTKETAEGKENEELLPLQNMVVQQTFQQQHLAFHWGKTKPIGRAGRMRTYVRRAEQ